MSVWVWQCFVPVSTVVYNGGVSEEPTLARKGAGYRVHTPHDSRLKGET